MKYFFLLLPLFALFQQNTMAQELDGWHLGISVQPFNYWLYNYNDWNDYGENSLYLKEVESQIGRFNGYAFGLTGEYFWSDRLGICLTPAFSHQQQEYIYTSDLEAVVGRFADLYTELQYLHLPVMLAYHLPMHTRSVNHIYVRAGVQTSFLANYTQVVHKLYREAYSPDEWITTYHNGTMTVVYTDVNGQKNTYNTIDWAYSRFTLGAVAALGWRGQWSDRVSMRLGVRGDYDFTNADNLDARFASGSPVWPGAITGGWRRWGEPRPPSHNIRFGLEMAVLYRL